MTRSLGYVKKEIRILGIDACNPKRLAGAIVRGGLYLDGVVAFSSNLDSKRLARRIRDTKYFPELKVIMIHDIMSRLDAKPIEKITGLPTIKILGGNRKRKGPLRSRDQLPLRFETTLDRSDLSRLLGITRVGDSLPEPVRVAHLLAKVNISGKSLQDKG